MWQQYCILQHLFNDYDVYENMARPENFNANGQYDVRSQDEWNLRICDFITCKHCPIKDYVNYLQYDSIYDY